MSHSVSVRAESPIRTGKASLMPHYSQENNQVYKSIDWLTTSSSQPTEPKQVFPKVENDGSFESRYRVAQQGSHSCCCIYKVPSVIREINEEAYTPKVVSIGPFHYSPYSRNLQSMHKHKRTYFLRFSNRAHTNWNLVLQFVRDSEPIVRECYSETIDLSIEIFMELILLDASFIIELFLSFSESRYSQDDPILSKPWLMSCIEMDLLLLENQLPFVFLQDLYQKAFQLHPNVPSFLTLTCLFFQHYNTQRLEPNNNILHFTDLLRAYHFQPNILTMTHRMPLEEEIHALSHTASELHEARVKLKASKSRCFLDLKFSRRTRVLEVPQIYVEDRTETIYRNMMALEQCHYPLHAYITDYIKFLDFLINTSQDVDQLIHGGIITNYLGESNEVAKLFNGLCKNIVLVNISSPYQKICRDLNEFCRDPWNKGMATLRRDYCNTPWKTVASFAGILILSLTIVQTVFSILQVVLK